MTESENVCHWNSSFALSVTVPPSAAVTAWLLWLNFPLPSRQWAAVSCWHGAPVSPLLSGPRAADDAHMTRECPRLLSSCAFLLDDAGGASMFYCLFVLLHVWDQTYFLVSSFKHGIYLICISARLQGSHRSIYQKSLNQLHLQCVFVCLCKWIATEHWFDRPPWLKDKIRSIWKETQNREQPRWWDTKQPHSYCIWLMGFHSSISDNHDKRDIHNRGFIFGPPSYALLKPPKFAAKNRNDVFNEEMFSANRRNTTTVFK